MSKAAVEELVMNAVQPRMRLGERPVSLVRVDTGPWLYLALLLVAAAFVLLVNQGQDLALMSVLVAALCALRIRSYAMVLTDEALYMVHLRGRTIGSVEVIRPLVAVGFDRNLLPDRARRQAVLGAAALPRRRRRQLRAPSPRRLDRHRRRLLGDVGHPADLARRILGGANPLLEVTAEVAKAERGGDPLDEEDRAEIDLPTVHPGDRDDRGDEQEPAGREDQVGADPVVGELGLLAADRSHLGPVIDPPRGGLEIGSAQFRPVPAPQRGLRSTGPPRTWTSKWRWQPTVRALPISPTSPTRSPGPDPLAAADPRRPAQVGVEVTAVLALAVDQEVVAVENRVEAAPGDAAAASRDEAGAAGGDDVEALMGPPAAARRPELARSRPGSVRAEDREDVAAVIDASARAEQKDGRESDDGSCPAPGSTLKVRFAASGYVDPAATTALTLKVCLPAPGSDTPSAIGTLSSARRRACIRTRRRPVEI